MNVKSLLANSWYRYPYVTGTSVIGIKYKDGILMVADMGGSSLTCLYLFYMILLIFQLNCDDFPLIYILWDQQYGNLFEEYGCLDTDYG